jgi:hypothetical protein
MFDEFKVDPAELDSASQRIMDCLPMPRDVPLEEIAGDAEWYGHGGVYEALSRFCTTWQVAIAFLRMSGEGASQSLIGAAANYVRENAAVEEDFQGVGKGIGGAVGSAIGGIAGGAVGGAVGGGIGSGIAKGVGAAAEGVTSIADRLTGGSAGEGGS